MRRREFLTLTSATLGGTVLYSLNRKASILKADQTAKQKNIRVPLRFFTEAQALIVAAAASRIFPTDETGPGANDAGVAIYIDRQLAGPYGRDRYRYTQAPFEENAPSEFGYQGKSTPRELYRAGLQLLNGFVERRAAEQDEQLHHIESTVFFTLLRRHTIEGMFCDPLHGGNADMLGWQLIGFPGPRMNNFDDIEKHYGESFRPQPIKLADAAGHSVRGSEDEK